MDSSLCSLFSTQSVFLRLEKYENEFETMRELFTLPQNLQKFCEDTSLQWIKLQEKNEDTEFAMKDDDERIQESNELRKQGNLLFNAKSDRNILGACRLYNDAIFAALDCKGCEEIALGFANRAMALQAFGYYSQAYDDCVCALKSGYPHAMRHKVVTRQAYCSLKLKDVQSLKKHLQELEGMSLNENFQKQFAELQESLKQLMIDKCSEQDEMEEEEEIKKSRNSQEMYVK